MDPSQLTIRELLKTHGAVMDELRRRSVVRSANNPASDLAELIFCNAFGWARENISASGYDATDATGLRYQIKARRLASPKGSRQLSAIRNLPLDPFDQLAGVLFDRDFAIVRAAIIPIEVVKRRARRSDHTNSWKFILTDDVWSEPNVMDATGEVQSAATAL
jgi:hypothetical protein